MLATGVLLSLATAMDPLTNAAASGMRTSMQALDMLANNLANSQTNGFKGDREFYNLYTSPDASEGSVQMPDLPTNWTDYAQGSLQGTSNPLDLAVSGDGFFAVDGPNGTLYTRDGGFRMSATGQLVTTDGYPLRGSTGKPVQLSTGQPFTVDSSGAILQGGAQVSQLQFSSFIDKTALSKQGANYFQFNGAATDITSASGIVHQGKLEASNVAPAESAVRLVVVMRQFEMLQKAISIGTDMNRQAIEEVAKTGQ